MSRVIKFRVWDREAKSYATSSYLGGYSVFNLNLRFELDCHTESWDGIVPLGYDFEQFIGLLDSQGREIYEGDIVEYFDQCYASDHRPNGREPIKWWFEPHDKEYAHDDIYYPLFGVVEWDEKALTYAPLISSQEDYNSNNFAYVCRRETSRFPQLNSRGLENYPPSYFKVIGNRHQNPELLST